MAKPDRSRRPAAGEPAPSAKVRAAGVHGRAAKAPAAGRDRRPADVVGPTRRQSILEAALEVFADSGYEAARLDDVAKHAGVAKGTLYLYFPNKQALFEDLIRSVVSPLLDKVAATAASVPPEELLAHLFAMFQKEVLGTRRKLILRLLISEGPRFPTISEFYYTNVVRRGLELLRGIARRAGANGSSSAELLERFPQLIVAPVILCVVWDGLFGKVCPLDVNGLLEAHRRILTADWSRDHENA